MQNEPKVAIIILNWNGYKDTIMCIESLKKLGYSNYKIIIVDNFSKENEGSRIKEKFHDIHLIQNKNNNGFSKGNNIAIKWAKDNGYEYVWILNNDTIVDKDSLKYQVRHLKRKEVGAVGSKIKFFDSNKIWSRGLYLIKFQLFPPGLKFFSNIDEGKEDHYSNTETAKEVQYISGCSMLIKLSLNSIYFDEEYFCYCEDLDLCYRINKEGYKIIYEPLSIVFHKVSQSSGGEKFNPYTAYYNYRNKLIFLHKVYSKKITFLLFLPIYFLCLLKDFIKILCVYKNKKQLFKATFKGVKDGIIFISKKKYK